MNVSQTDMAFTILNNVHVTVYDSKRSIIRQEYETHNKASRNMITGILRFLHGYFTPTVLNNTALNADSAKSYIPCFFNVGDGGVVIVDGKPSFKPDSRTPELPVSLFSQHEFPQGSL